MEGYCFYCMLPVNNTNVCPHCGYNGNSESFTHRLPAGTVLKDRFLIGNAIGEGGFGITYIGRDLTLDMRIAVKEYYPNGYVNRNNTVSECLTATGTISSALFDKGKARFINEAKSLARFSGESGIVDVRDYFEANNTAYIVMEYLDGKTLKVRLEEKGLFSSDEIFRLMEPVFNSLDKIHSEGIIHRDISPDNIMMLKNGTLKIMDFGSARDFDTESPKSLSIMLKPGYAPEEQYRTKGNQGPWTDIYALSATIYKCITGKTPLDALDRVNHDELLPPSAYGIAIDNIKETALMKGLAIRAENRLKSVSEFKAMLNPACPQPMQIPSVQAQFGSTAVSLIKNPVPIQATFSNILSSVATELPQITVQPSTTLSPNITVQPNTTSQPNLNDAILTRGSLGDSFVRGTQNNTPTESSNIVSPIQPINSTGVTAKKSKLGITITAALAVAVVVIGIMVAYASTSHPSSKNSTNPSAASNSSKSETSSKSDASSNESSKVSPTSDWTTFKFTLDSVEYTLPFDYSLLEENGWSCDLSESDYSENYVLNPKDHTPCTIPIEKNGLDNFCGMFVGTANLGNELCGIKEGQVYAISMDIFLLDKGDKYPEIELPGGIKWGSTSDEIIAAFGTPTSSYYSNVLEYNSYTYYQNDTLNSLVLDVYEDGGLKDVSYYIYEP
ncbi:MAG: serine/threonine protein kinase [Lachnospiraceae bacterium]|nr:serine/threonine protein kinase [Lachnospiraceae bacterium]